MISAAASVEDVGEIVRATPAGVRLVPVAGASKPALSDPGDGPDGAAVERLDVSGLSGISEYDPAELTITALAGTPVSEVQAALAEHGQYLPFDPPLAGTGATLGGAVAAGASGPGALRHGGVRDFVIGVRFVDGTGRLVSGGGKVVKNAAGFDLPKLLTGSIGRLGVIVSLSFKVFPQPLATATLRVTAGGLDQALAALSVLRPSPVELDSLDVSADGTVLARVGGRPEILESRMRRLRGAIAGEATVLAGPDELELWRSAAELAWRRESDAVIRVGLSVRRLPALAAAIRAAAPQAQLRASLGGTVAWIGWPADVPLGALAAALDELALPGTLLLGRGPALLGPRSAGAFASRVKLALDPDGRFLEL